MTMKQLMTTQQLIMMTAGLMPLMTTRQLMTAGLMPYKKTMDLLMTVHRNTFPVHVYSTVVHVLINNVVLSNILAFKLIKRCITIHVSRFCGSSQRNDMASLEKTHSVFLVAILLNPPFVLFPNTIHTIVPS